MKFFKQILSLILLFSITSVDAKKRGAQAPRTTQPTTLPAQTPQPTPIAPPAMQQPSLMQPQSYAQALNAIKTKMTADQVLVNNTFTPQFINFIESLRLSPLEITALLQAGINIHAAWTDNNEMNINILSSLRNNIQTITQAQPAPQAQPIQPPRQVSPPQQPAQQFIPPQQQPPVKQRRQRQPRQPQQKPRRQAQTPQPVVQQLPFKKMEPAQDAGPAENRFFMNNLVMILDPHTAETIQEGVEAMAVEALTVLYQKAAPIIMTTNIFEIIMTLRQHLGDQELQKLSALKGQQLWFYAEQLSKKVRIAGLGPLYIVFLSSIYFDTNNLNCYFHTSEKLVLLIPKLYIQTHMPSAMNFSLNDQAKVCGFNPAVLTAITDLSSNNLMQQIQLQNAKPTGEEQFIPHLTSMFIIQEKNDELIHPEQTSKWLIYLAGHGGPAYILQEERYSKEELVAQIAGLGGSQFEQLMKFFDTKIDTAYLHYMTCFSGGSNQTFVNETLSSLNVKFIVSSQGIQEGYVSSGVFQIAYTPTSLQITGHDFAEFFKRLRMFFTQKAPTTKPGKTKTPKKKQDMEDPILKIIQTIIDNRAQIQPFVRFPSAESFVPIPLTKTTKVLTETLVRAHEIEQKPFNITADVLILNTPRINVAINVKGLPTAIVIPSPEKFLPGYEAITVFKEINWQNTLQSLLYNCSYLNTHLYPQTMVINTLSGILLQESGLPKPQGSSNIRHFIMDIRSVPGKNPSPGPQPAMTFNEINGEDVKIAQVGSNIYVCFEYNNAIYQGMFAIRDIEEIKELSQNIQQLRFTAMPKNSINMETLAPTFLSSEEIPQIAKPITLESIIKFIDSKIDKQDPSAAIWSEADIKDLRKFATDRTNK